MSLHRTQRIEKTAWSSLGSPGCEKRHWSDNRTGRGLRIDGLGIAVAGAGSSRRGHCNSFVGKTSEFFEN